MPPDGINALIDVGAYGDAGDQFTGLGEQMKEGFLERLRGELSLEDE